MKVLILAAADAAIARAGDIVSRVLQALPESALGLATGGTVLPSCDDFVARHEAAGLSFARAVAPNLDKYMGLPPRYPCSCRRHMREALFDRVHLDRARSHLPRGGRADPQAGAEACEVRISAAGGTDPQTLGIDGNGHIVVNEPTASPGSRTRIATLTEDTRRANRKFSAFGETPRDALMIGVATIRDARAMLPPGKGEAKAEAVAGMVHGPLCAASPASAIWLHTDATIVPDAAAAASLTFRSYCETFHPGGRDCAFD